MERRIGALSQPNVLWLQVGGLALVQGAITLTWLIYGLYLPQLLAKFGFSQSLAAGLLIVEAALAVVMEPLMGGLSDRAKRWMGSRFPFISVGVILSSALFIAIPCIVTFVTPTVVLRSLLPMVLVAWALAMTVFRSPAISLLGQYAAPAELPLAASLLTLTGGLIGAFKPVANKFILSLGAGFTFAIGSFVLLGAAAVLRFVTPPETPALPTSNQTKSLLPSLGLILGTGAGVGWGSRFLMDALGKVLKASLNTQNIDWLMVGIAIALALAALPAGVLAVRIGNRRAMLSGIAGTILLMLLMVYMPTPSATIPSLIGIVAALSLVVNGAVPFALSLVPPQRAGLGTGMYFGGAALAASVFGVVFPQTQGITPVAGGIGGAIAFLVAGICIAASRNLGIHSDAQA